MQGFIYIWRDRKHNRYYIGSHWGTEDDGYICSSPWMKRAYKIRPQDFKRRILEAQIERDKLTEREHYWLQLIKENELGNRYYNLRNNRFGHWSTKSDTKSIRQRISEANRTRIITDEHRRNLSLANKGKPGQPKSEETRRKISEARKGKPSGYAGKRHSLESIAKMSLAKKGKPSPLKGRQLQKETR